MLETSSSACSSKALSPAHPHPIPPSKSSKTDPTFTLVHRSLRDFTLSSYALDDFVKARLYDDTSDNQLAKSSVQGFEVENEV